MKISFKNSMRHGGEKEWSALDILLADNFTLMSPNGDDHISKSFLKTRCWDFQIELIGHLEVEKSIGDGKGAFVKYLGRTNNGKSFQNVDYLQLNGGKVETIECYFGGQFGFSSAATIGQRGNRRCPAMPVRRLRQVN